MAPALKALTKPTTVTRRIIMQKARRHPVRRHSAPTACRHMVSGSFPPLEGVLFIFRSRYLFTIGRQRVLSLRRWASQIQTGFHVTGPTRVPNGDCSAFEYGTVTLYGSAFQRTSSSCQFCNFICRPHNPAGRSRRFRLFPFRSPLLRESSFLSFPAGTEMFQFPAFAPHDLWIQSYGNSGIPGSMLV